MSFLMYFKKHALWPAHTVSQIHECTVAHIAMLLLAKARPHNVSHSSSLSSLLSTKPWYESEVETLTEEEIKERLLSCLCHFVNMIQLVTIIIL